MQQLTYKTIRRSPIAFDAKPLQVRTHNGFEVVLKYDHEPATPENAPAIIDLSHVSKWDVQDPDLDQVKPMGQSIPGETGACAIHGDALCILRLNPSQAAVWCIGNRETQDMADNPFHGPAYTDTTDAHALLAVVGPSVPAFMERITSLDLTAPHRKTPFVIQGPILHIACRVLAVTLTNEKSIVLFSFSRGYGRAMTAALLDSGSRQGVYFAGEQQFRSYVPLSSMG